MSKIVKAKYQVKTKNPIPGQLGSAGVALTKGVAKGLGITIAGAWSVINKTMTAPQIDEAELKHLMELCSKSDDQISVEMASLQDIQPVTAMSIQAELALKKMGCSIQQVELMEDRTIGMEATTSQGETLILNCNSSELVFDMVGFSGEACSLLSQEFFKEIAEFGAQISEVHEVKHLKPGGVLVGGAKSKNKIKNLHQALKHSAKKNKGVKKRHKSDNHQRQAQRGLS